MVPFHRSKLGSIYHGDALDVLEQRVKPGSVDLIVTSPPFGLVRKKDYGNVDASNYVEWFKPFGHLFKKALKSSGSLVIDFGPAFLPCFMAVHFGPANAKKNPSRSTTNTGARRAA